MISRSAPLLVIVPPYKLSSFHLDDHLNPILLAELLLSIAKLFLKEDPCFSTISLALRPHLAAKSALHN